jgi:WD40 repeat protein
MSMSDRLEGGLVRIGGPGAVEGGGLLVGDRHVITCAHVVGEVLERKSRLQYRSTAPTEALTVSFPAAGDRHATARVLTEGWQPITKDGSGDIAVLELGSPAPAGCEAPPLLSPLEPQDHKFIAHGFPPGFEAEHPKGAPAEGTIGSGAGPRGEWRLLVDTALLIQPGFSGTPIWDATVGAVVGIAVANDHGLVPDRGRQKEAAFMIPLPVLIRAWPPLADHVGWRVRFDPDREKHWALPRLGRRRGPEMKLVGRQAVMAELRQWVTSDDSGLLVVTGRKGSGKSAVLGELIRGDLPDLGIVAAGLSLGQIAAEIGKWNGVDAEDAAALETGLAAKKKIEPRWKAPTIVIDQLDEAIEPGEVVQSLFQNLDDAGLARFAFALPAGPAMDIVLRNLSTYRKIDLEDDRYFDSRDMEAFVATLLGDIEGTEVAKQITARAEPSFLVARLVAVWVTESDEKDRPSPEAYPAAVDDAMEAYIVLAARALAKTDIERAREETKVRGLLTALAYAETPGLPRDGAAWPTIAEAVTEAGFTEGDGKELCEGPAGYLIESQEADEGVTHCALFHPAMAEALGRNDPNVAPLRQSRIATALSEMPTSPDDASLDPYVRSRLPEHVWRAGTAAWASLAGRREVLDRLDPAALGVAARRAALAGEELPDEILGILNYGRQFGSCRPADQRVLRQLGMARVTGWSSSIGEGGDTGFDWELASAALRQHPPHVTIDGEQGICGLAVANDGRGHLLAAACDDGSVRLWRAATGEALPGRKPSGDHARAIATAFDGEASWIAWSDDRGRLRVWSPESNTELASIAAGSVRALGAFFAGPHLCLVTGGAQHHMRVWSGSAEIAHLPVGAPVQALVAQFHGMTAEIVAGDEEGRVTIWRLEADEIAALVKTAEPAELGAGNRLHGSSDWVRTIYSDLGWGNPALVAAGEDGRVHYWPSAESRAILIGAHEGKVLASTGYVDDGTQMIATGGADRLVRLWDPGSPEPVRLALTGHQSEIRGLVSYESEGTVRIASAGAGGTLRVWDPHYAGPSDRQESDEDAVTAVMALGEGKDSIAVTGHGDGSVRIWDPATGEQISDGFRAHDGAVRALVPYGAGIASGGDDERVSFRDAYFGTELAPTLHGHSLPVRAIVPGLELEGDDVIATGSEDGTLRLWRTVTQSGRDHWEEVISQRRAFDGPIRGIAALDLGSNGSFLAVVGTGPALGLVPLGVTDMTTQLFRVGSSWSMAVAVDQATLVPRIAVCDDDGGVWSWEPLRQSKPAVPLTRHAGPTRAVAFLRHGDRTLIASGGGGALCLNDPADASRRRHLPLGIEITSLCALGDRLLVGTPEGHLVIGCFADDQ